MKIYLDVCCLNRPFDNQLHDRIKLESDAVLRILQHCENNEWQLIGSEVIDYEVSRIRSLDKKKKVESLANIANHTIIINEEIEKRAIEIQKYNIKAFDALHIACAESEQVDVMLTTDDYLLKKANLHKKDILITMNNPVIWLMEVVRK